MNILIVSITHPIAIMELTNLYSFDTDTCSVFSPQALALLNERTFNKPFLPSSYAFMETISQKPSLCVEPRKHNIVFGNLIKSTPIKWDNIIYYKPLYLEDEQDYTKLAAKEIPDFPALFTEADCEYTFNDLPHLRLFLSTLGFKEEPNDNKTE